MTTSQDKLVLGFPRNIETSKRFAAEMQLPFAEVKIHHFPDKESMVTLPAKLPPHVFMYCTLDRPNNKLIEVMLAAKTARRLGAQRLTLIAPYLCYMRQDIENHPGESISQLIVGQFLADLFDDVITVDPHLHRIERLSQAVPIANAISLSAMPLLARHIAAHVSQGVLLGPDAESEQWVKQVASDMGFDYVIATKTRLSDNEVIIQLSDSDLKGKTVVIIDDVASTGHTVAVATGLCLERGAKDIQLAVTHALFSGDAEQLIINSGVSNIISTDSIHHTSNVVPLAALLAEHARQLN